MKTWAIGAYGRDREACAVVRNPACAELPAFQRDAADRVVALLRERGGAVLADDVGLGKTWVALAALSALRPRWPRALVVAPAAVLPAWRRCLRGAPVTLVSYAALVRGSAGREPWDVVVVDEAHRARNPATQRHRILAALALRAPTLLVTATPYFHSARDLSALLRLVAPSAPAPADIEGLRRALSERTVRRQRRELEACYGALAVPGAAAGLPGRRRERLRFELGPAARGLLEETPALVAAAFPEPELGELRALLGHSLLLRLASSTEAFAASLRRARRFLERAVEAATCGRRLSRRDFARDFARELGGGPRQGVLPFFFAPGDGGESASGVELAPALATLEASMVRVERALAEPDPRRAGLLALLARAEPPTLLMTAHGATARALHGSLVAGFDPRAALLTGSTARIGRERASREAVLARFAPVGQGVAVPPSQRLWTLVATDVLREGVNLQDANTLIHCDRSWNPAAAAQREGRVDRLGRPDDSPLLFVTIDPPAELEARLGVARRYGQRAREGARCLGGAHDGLLDERSWALAFARMAPDSARDSAAQARPARQPSGVLRLPAGGEDGWLLAVAFRGRVRLVWHDGARCEDGLARLLRWLDHPIDAQTSGFPGSAVEADARAWVEAAYSRALEPGPEGGRLAPRGRAALEDSCLAADAHRRGGGGEALSPRTLGERARWDSREGEGGAEARVVACLRVVAHARCT